MLDTFLRGPRSCKLEPSCTCARPLHTTANLHCKSRQLLSRLLPPEQPALRSDMAMLTSRNSHIEPQSVQ